MGEADDMELVYSLIGYPNETEWIEFKTGNNEPNHIGRDISALANSAAYLGRTRRLHPRGKFDHPSYRWLG